MLFISNLPATIKKGTTFKLTCVNPLYEDTADYTFDVQLPLQGSPENQKIFGPLHHPAQPLTTLIGTELPMHLVLPPIDMQGKARITSITEKEVKVQLIASPLIGAFGYNADGTPIYIDQLKLGTMYDDAPFIQSVPHAGTTPTTHEIAKYISDNYETQGNHTYTWGLYEQTHFLFHFVDDAQGAVINRHERFTDGTIRFAADTPTAAQPYLLEIIDRILHAVGITTVNIPIRTDWRQNIYITNTAANNEIARILPHWTLQEFLTEICNFFALTYTLSTDHRTITFQPLTPNTPTTTLHITQPLNTITTEIAEATDQSKSITTANTDYDTSDIPNPIHLPEEVWTKATLRTFETYTELRGYALGLGRDSWHLHQDLLLIDLSTLNTYAFLADASITGETTQGKYQLTQVNQFGPLIPSATPYLPTTNRDIAIKLRILPARMQWEVFRITYQYQSYYIPDPVANPSGNPVPYKRITATEDKDYPHLLSATTAGTIQPYSINTAINTTDTNTDTITAPTTIEVALNTTATYQLAPTTTLPNQETIPNFPTEKYQVPTEITQGLPIPTPLGINYLQHPTTNYYLPITLTPTTQGSLPTLHPFTLLHTNQPTAHQPTTDPTPTIDTRAEHTIQYLDTDIPIDPTAIYIIHSRRYACHKIEITLTPTTIQPIRTGYFYEIN